MSLSWAHPFGQKSAVPGRVVAVVAGGLLLTSTVLVAPRSLSAQEEFPITADPASCSVEPRALPLWDGTPAAISEVVQPDPDEGGPADDATIRGVSSTIIESAACANAGQPLRVFALVTDDFLARQFMGEGAADVTESGARLERPEPTPDPSEYVTVVAIDDVVSYPDGTVGAAVTSENSDGTYRDYVLFVEGETRWLIEASFPIDDSAGTPGA